MNAESQIALIDKETVESQARRQQNMAKLAEVNQEIANANLRLKQAKAKQQEAAAARQEAQHTLKQCEKERKRILTRVFLSIFTKNPITEEESNRLFGTYLTNGDIVNEKGPKGPYSRINSMEAIRRYLQDHPDVKTCDFRHFEENVSDIPTFAEILKKNLTITAVAFSNSIPETAKAQLEEARIARNGSLKVRYFA